MTHINRLRLEALKACNGRGHKMSRFTRLASHTMESICRRCNRGVCLNTKPAPNEIDISGEAVALNCKP